MRYLAIALLFTLLASSVHAELPTPAPPPEPPMDTMPAGDPSVTFPTPESTPEPTPEPTPTPLSEPMSEPAPLPRLAPGPADLAVRVCIDLDADGHCGATEGIAGVPVVLFDASTGATLADGKTDAQGTYRALLQITDGMDLAAAAPALGLSSQVWDTRRGVVLLLADVPIVPVRLP